MTTTPGQPQRYHQRTWLKEFGHPRPHVHAAQWTHASDKFDLDAIQALTEHGEQCGELLQVWSTFLGTSGNVELGSWVLRDECGNVFVMYDGHFRDRYEECGMTCDAAGVDAAGLHSGPGGQ